MSASIQVAIKVRPLIKREDDENLPIQWTVQDKCIAPLDTELKKRGEGGFYFDHIFDMNTTTMDVFDTIAKPIIEATVNGFNGTIFAYGQTSSGKTYTMMGTRDVPGVIPLSVVHIFDLINNSDRQFLLRVSYIEIYNEKVNDLLNPDGVDLKIKEDPKTGQAYVKCKEELVNCTEKILAIMKKGDKNRRIGETNMNERSSRSHTILRITIESRDVNADEAGAVQVSQLNLVDLAGSERSGQTGAIGARFKEGTHINMSLSALGLVIMQLSDSQDNPKIFVNFRDSKLTRILQCSLGGNAMTTIICAVTPAALEETQCTLAFASRAKRIKNKPKVNEELSDATLLKRYAKHIKKLETELKNVKSADVVEMESKLLEKERANQILEERIELLKNSILCGNSTCKKEEFVQADYKRRRTWGGCGTLGTKNPLFHNAIGLPTIVEAEKTPEKKKENFKEKSKQRQSIIIQEVDIANQSFQTEFTDFELELIKCERERADGRLSDGSSGGDDDYSVAKRPQRTVTFRTDDLICNANRQSFETTTDEPKSPEQCNGEPDPDDTPKRRRIKFLVENYHSLNEETVTLMEFTKLERQMIVDDEVQKAMAVHKERLASKEQMLSELNDKYTDLLIHSATTDKLLARSKERLAEFERQMIESTNSLRALRSEKQALADELNMLRGENSTINSSPSNKDEEKETSSIFENASYFEEMNVSDSQTDSVFNNDTLNAQSIQDLTMYENNPANITANTTVTSDVREINLLTEKLKETIQLLTVENADLMNKLSNEKERADKNEKNLQETIAELLSKIHGITEEKNLLRNSMSELERRVESFNDTSPHCATDDEIANIKNYKDIIASLTAENEELSTNLMNKIEELEHVKDIKSPPGDHDCAYRELSINLSERNKLLENENIGLSNNLMEKIEEYEHIKKDLETLNKRHSSASLSQTNSNNLLEISIDNSNAIEKEATVRTVDDLLRLSIGPDNSSRTNLIKQPSNGDATKDLLLMSIVENGSICDATKNTNAPDELAMERGEKCNGSEIGCPTIDEILQISMIPNGTAHGITSKNDSTLHNADTWKIKAEMLAEQVKDLQSLNDKLKNLKLTTCKQCAYLTELTENGKALKVEIKETRVKVKEANMKLQKMQDKFDREYAHGEILRTKANEDLNISLSDSTLNESAILDGSFSVSIVEERVQRLRQELDILSEQHGKLTNAYNEKCDEIEKLHDVSSREATPSPSSTDTTTKTKRCDAKIDKLQTDMESLKTDLRRLKKGIGGISAGLQKFDNEKSTMRNEIDALRAEKRELEEKSRLNDDSLIARERIEILKKEVERLREEIDSFGVVKKDLENAKASLEAQVQSLKSSNTLSEEKSTETEDSSIAEERIKSLESEVTRLSEEIKAHNVAKEQLLNAKLSLEAEVLSLKTARDSIEKTVVDNEDSKAESIPSLEYQVTRLTEEIRISNVVKEELCNAKLSLEAEVEVLKIAKDSHDEKLTTIEDTSTAEKKIALLENELSRLSKEINTSNIAYQELQNTKQSLENEVQSLKIAKESLEEKFAAIEIPNSSIADKKIEQLENEVARLNEQIESSNIANRDLQNAKLLVVNEVQSLRTAKELLEEKFAEIENLSITKEKIDELEHEVAHLNEHIETSNVVNRQLQDSKSSLEAEVQSLKATKDAFEKKFAETADLSVEKEKIQRLEIEVTSLNEQIDISTMVIHQLQDSKSSLETEVQSLITAKESLEKKFATIADSPVQDEKIKQLEIDVASLNEQIENSAVVIRQLQDAKSSLEAECEFLTSQKTIIEEGSTELIRSLRNVEENNASLKLELERLTRENGEIVANRSTKTLEIVDSPNNNIGDYATTVESLKLKLKEATDNATNAVERNAELNERLTIIATAEAELNDVKSQLRDVTKNLHELATENSSLKEKLVEFRTSEEESMNNSQSLLDNEVKSLKAEITKLESSLTILNETISELENKNSSLTTELESVKREKRNSNIAEFSADSPYETLKEYETMVEELRTKLHEITNNLHANARETRELNDQLTKLSATNEEFNEIRLSLESEVTNLKIERNELESKLTNLRGSLDELEQRNAFLITELETIKLEKERISKESQASQIHAGELVEKSDLLELEKTIDTLSTRVREITAELDRYVAENVELNGKVTELESTLRNRAENCIETDLSTIDDNLREELKAARDCITKEIQSMKSTTESQDFMKKSVSELFTLFVREIMSKEQEIMKMLTSNHEREKRKLEESKRQSVDAEKRANVWAKELEAEIERIQQDLIRQETKNAEFNGEISKVRNLLMESNHENEMLKEKMKVLELDFNTLQADLETRSKHNTTLNTTQQDKERLNEEALATRELELSSKLRLAEKNYREKLEELTNALESSKIKNMELTNNLEGLEMNERQLRNIVDMKTTELVKCNNTIDRIQGELAHITERHSQLTLDHDQKSQQIDEITALLKNKCDKLSEYKTKLETITPEYEGLKDQAAERLLRLEKYKSEIECITSENEKQQAALRDKLESEEIKSLSYRKQLAELTNKNTMINMELEELRTKCDELDISNGKLAKSLRKSTSKIRAEEEMEDLRDSNRTLQRNLDGAANRITELQEMKTHMMKELAELRGAYEVLSNENTEMKNTLASHRSSANDAIELRGKYELLLQEKNRMALELEDKRSNLVMMEARLESCVRENDELRSTNKDLDEEMDDMLQKIKELTKENAELDDKLHELSTRMRDTDQPQIAELGGDVQRQKSQIEKYESDIEGLRLQRDRLRNEHEAAAGTVEILKIENNELRSKIAHLERADSLSCESSRSDSPALDLGAARVDSRRRRSRTELFNQKRQLEVFEIDGKYPWGEGCRCIALDKKVRELEYDLVTKNGKIAALEIRIESENFPYMTRAKDLEEMVAALKRKNQTIMAEMLKLRDLKNTEMSSECKRCKHWKANSCDKSSQCMPETSQIYLSGMSSGFVEDHIKMEKLKKINETLKQLCRTRQKNIFDLQSQIKKMEMEKELTDTNSHVDEKTELSTMSSRNTSSKTDSSSFPR